MEQFTSAAASNARAKRASSQALTDAAAAAAADADADASKGANEVHALAAAPAPAPAGKRLPAAVSPAPASSAPASTSSTPQPLPPPSFSIGEGPPPARPALHQSQLRHFQSPYPPTHSQAPPPPSPGLEVALAQLTQQQAHTHQQLFSQQVVQLQNQLARVQKDVALLHEHQRQQYEQRQIVMLCLAMGVAAYTLMKR